MPDTYDTSSPRNDHLCRLAGTMLTEVDIPDSRSVLCLVYNVLPDPPGPPAYEVVPTDPEMWDCGMPREALGLMTQVTLLAPLNRPPGAAPAPLAHIRVDPRSGRRLDGIALLYRAWSIDGTTAAGRALQANVLEGFYRHGDIAASPARRDVRMISAVDRNSVPVALVRDPGGPVMDIVAAGSQRAIDMKVMVHGDVFSGLDRLLRALQIRFVARPEQSRAGRSAGGAHRSSGRRVPAARHKHRAARRR